MDPSPASTAHRLRVAVLGAGPVGLTLALLAARRMPSVQLTVFEARPIDHDLRSDPRTLALACGSVQSFERLAVWSAMAGAAQPIRVVHVSQQQPALLWPLRGEPEVLIRADDEGVAQLGAVAPYGVVTAPLQAAWLEACAREPQRLVARFCQRVAAIKPLTAGVELDAGIAEAFDLVVVAEGGVFSEQSRKPVNRDYGQTAWVGTVELEGSLPGAAFERFTPQGPAALLPLPSGGGAAGRAALVWCVSAADDPVRDLNEAQRMAVLNNIFPRAAGRITAVSALHSFALGLNAQRTLVNGREIRIGNAAQTMHPVAGQGLNLGLRDAQALVDALAPVRRADELDAALRRVEWQRAGDRWALIAATDFLARSFTWQVPGLATLRGLGLAALEAAPPLKSLLARRMMFGLR